MERKDVLWLGGGVAVLGGALLAWLLGQGSSAPSAPDNPCESTGPPGAQPGVPAGWSMYTGAVSATATGAASAALSLPIGSSQTFTDDDGSPLGILVMWHCHDPSSGMTPVGWHKGATLFRIG